jgi:hypothetical protein
MCRPGVLLVALALAGCSALRREAPPPELSGPPAPAPAPAHHLACIEHPRIDTWERRLRSRALAADTRRSIERGRVHLPAVRRILADAGLPPSLALLPVLESGYHRDARGRLDEVGLWQLRRATARRFGLKVRRRDDQRLDPHHSTRAAARYLRALHRRYRDWPLALAAYNAGERRVDRALARRRGADFWELSQQGRLPRGSREYVPRFLAVVRIVEGVDGCRRPQPDPLRSARR